MEYTNDVPEIKTTKEASEKYDKYIQEHVANVQKAWAWMKSNLKSIPDELIDLIDEDIKRHDKSKYDTEEYAAYACYFNIDQKKYANEFNYAWLHHIHNNPHHWQHWVLINDEDGTVGLEIPKRYVYHMIADWWSFSWKTNKLDEIFKWYVTHKKNMIMNAETVKLVESILSEIQTIIDKENE